MASILLYSSGLDSELYRLMENPDKLIFFRSGARYENLEYAQLKKFQSNGLLKNHEVLIDDTLNFKSLEGDNCIVPMRNIFYILRAFEYADDVYLGVTYYDLHYDKQPDVHNALVSFLQSYYYCRETPKTWESKFPNILTPYRTFSKADLLKEAIERGIDVSHIPTLRTCYDSHSEKGCGMCKPCLHKAMTLAVNDMFKTELFDNDPRKVAEEKLKTLQQEDYIPYDVEYLRRELQTLVGV